MVTKAGVWIDHKQATIVLITNAGQDFQKIACKVEQAVRATGGGKPKRAYARNDFMAEDKLERKAENHRKEYYADVLAALRGSSAVLILGPGEAGGQLRKQIQAKNLRGLTVELETADKMTDRQSAAKVSQHFSPGTVRKSVAPKKFTTATSAKRTKEAAKK